MNSGWSQLSFLCSNAARIVRTCGTVIAGVDFFSLLRFLREEPVGHQRKCLMMMPAAPRANFVVGQAAFPLGALETFFDAMSRLAHAGELLQRRLGQRIREIVIVLHRAIRLTFANHHQRFVEAVAGRGLGADADLDRFDHQRSTRT